MRMLLCRTWMRWQELDVVQLKHRLRNSRACVSVSVYGMWVCVFLFQRLHLFHFDFIHRSRCACFPFAVSISEHFKYADSWMAILMNYITVHFGHQKQQHQRRKEKIELRTESRSGHDDEKSTHSTRAQTLFCRIVLLAFFVDLFSFGFSNLNFFFSSVLFQYSLRSKHCMCMWHINRGEMHIVRLVVYSLK